jgi:UDP-N-acetylglucosamine 4,6-dehydratase
MVEYNVEEAIKTNIIGGLNLIRACLENEVEKVVFVSTDKACSPVNTYGACKFVGERIFAESNFNKGNSKTIFTVVRYGNVLESTGSVIPFFIDKIKNNEQIPLTDERMTRFIITQEQAVQLIFKAIKYGVGGEVFVPKLPSMRVVDLVEVLREKFNSQVGIRIIGIRPGEKIHELMVNDSEVSRVYDFENLYVIYSFLLGKFISSAKQGDYSLYGKRLNVELMREYSSKDNVVSKEELRGILGALDIR